MTQALQSKQHRAAYTRAYNKASEGPPTLPAATMAGIRLRGVLDAGQRAGLTVWQLIGLADRVLMGEPTDLDADLFGAFDPHDLAAVGMTAASFVVQYAAQYRAVAAFMRPMHTDACATTFARATASMRDVAGMLRERLQALPDADELQRVGDLFERGVLTPADLAVVRALPGPYLRAQATAGHWRVFVDYRLHED